MIAKNENKYIAMLSIAGYEGCRLSKYKDTKGYWTIGFGHLILEGESYNKKLSFSAADHLFEQDFETCMEAATSVPNYSELNDARKIAILNIVYNMGAPGFIKKFPSCIRAIKNLNFKEAAAQLLCGSSKNVKSKYLKEVGQRALDVAKLLESGKLEDVVINEVNYGPDGARKSKSYFWEHLNVNKPKYTERVTASLPKDLYVALVASGADVLKA